ncbi:hypothetical protein [Halobacterium yunchengense]|uniref:hypothetical protein n=1 Tax=Halobacterium yunchengense TaxID=3108497 RepID=UPI00300A915F
MGFDDLEAAEREHRERASDGEGRGEDERPDAVEQPSDAERTSGDEQRVDERAVDDSGAAEDRSTGPGQASESPAESSSAGGDGQVGRVSTEPAFEFAAVKQSPMYARPESWAALEDALDLEVVRALRESGVRNEAKRELHDAALRVAAAHPDEIADAVREARRED